MVQSMWLDDSDCTPSTSSSPGKKERKKKEREKKSPTCASQSIREVELHSFGKTFCMLYLRFE